MEEPLKASWFAVNAGRDGTPDGVSYGRVDIYLPRRSIYEFGRLSSTSRRNTFQNITSVPPPTRQKSINLRKNPPTNVKGR